MDLTPYVNAVSEELAVAAEAGGPEARALAERLAAPLESAIRLTLLDALSAAAAEITRDLAPGSVDLRLRAANPVSSSPRRRLSRFGVTRRSRRRALPSGSRWSWTRGR